MPFSGQVFSVGQVLTAAEMNQREENIVEVRTSHASSATPPELEAGVTWIDQRSAVWATRVHDGSAFTLVGDIDPANDLFTPIAQDAKVSPFLGKNKIINGNFDLALRANSEQITLGAGGPYVMDRWRVTGTGVRQIGVTQESFTLGQTDVPNEPKFFHRMDVTTGGDTIGLSQRIEGVQTLAGKQATLSFYAKIDAGTLVTAPRLIQNFGTGGSPSAGTTASGGAITITGSFQRFTETFSMANLSGKTLGDDGNDYVQFDVIIENSGTLVTLDMAQVQLEEGRVATEFEQRLFAQEQNLAKRYFRTVRGMAGNWNGTTLVWAAIDFNDAPMRATPSVSLRFVDPIRFRDDGSDLTSSLTAISVTTMSPTGGSMRFSGFAGATAGRGTVCRTNSDWLDFDAEL